MMEDFAAAGLRIYPYPTSTLKPGKTCVKVILLDLKAPQIVEEKFPNV